jgi:uncharacterized protein YgbK (DUF1537 family)
MKCVIIADDNTGASDAAGMLTERGMSACLALDGKYDMRIFSRFDAVVLGTRSRSVSPEKAYRITAQALKKIAPMKLRLIQIKYCSTFDSTPSGNIGPSLDAAIDSAGARSIIVCPALPVNQRITVMGYHFVNGTLLSESPMRHHPLNPMSDSNLVRWLSLQTKRKVSLANISEVRKGAASLRSYFQGLENAGVSYIVSDAINERDIRIIMDASSEKRIISGSSGISAEIPRTLATHGKNLSFRDRIKRLAPRMAVVSGSMSPTTRIQNENAVKAGFSGFPVDAARMLARKFDEAGLVKKALSSISVGKDVIVYTSAADAGEVEKAAAGLGLDPVQGGILIGKGLARIAEKLVRSGMIGRFVVSGGETSGIICERLAYSFLEVGLPIAPGVPYCFPIGGNDIMLVLKSGNFGGLDLYEKVKNL